MTLEVNGWKFDLIRESSYGGAFKRITAVCIADEHPFRIVGCDYKSGADETPVLNFLKDKLETITAEAGPPPARTHES